MLTIHLTVWSALVWLLPTTHAQSGKAFDFANPSPETRILKIIHSWPDNYEAQDQLIARLQRQGFGGVVCNVSFDQYLESEPKWQAFVRAVKHARESGMALWLYDERGYPSGNAGGLVLRDHPEWEARGLLEVHHETENGMVDFAVPPGKVLLAASFQIRDGRIDLETQRDLSVQIRDGRLQWQSPSGQWLAMVVTEDRLYEGTHADGNLWQKMPYINLLMPEPTARFVQVTHQRYADKLGSDLGRWFMATFTDEPSLMSCFLKPMPYRPLPWAPNLPIEFQKRRGYALDATVIPSLFVDAGASTQKHRYDFWLTVGELVSENFFGQIQTWCRQHNIPSGGHLLMEESIVAHVPLYGDFFRCVRRLDAPSIDCLTSLPGEVPWFIARLVASAAELEGRDLVMSETSDHGQVWRSPGDSRPKRIVTESEIRGTCNRQIVAGVNCITSYYSFTDLTDGQLRRLNEWVGRCCGMLRGGLQAAQIAVLYPAESLWTKFTPARHWANEAPRASRIESIYRAAIESLFVHQREFTMVDSRALADAQIEQDCLVHGKLCWNVVILPGADTLPMAAWEKLARFVRAGGVVIAIGDLPANSESEFPSPMVQRMARELFGDPGERQRVTPNPAGGAGVFLPAGSESLLPMILNGLLEPDIRVVPGSSPIRATHRRMNDNHVWFIINDSPQPWSGEVSFSAEGTGELLDPATGGKTAGIKAGGFALKLEPYGAAFARFGTARAPRRLPAKSGQIPNLLLRPLPAETASLINGEFVSASLKSGVVGAPSEPSVFQATGKITKSNVDTFLFVNLQRTN
ncbi:MAG: glycosyl hydrolase, partial [Verrucomicrobiia bacterium]